MSRQDRRRLNRAYKEFKSINQLLNPNKITMNQYNEWVDFIHSLSGLYFSYSFVKNQLKDNLHKGISFEVGLKVIRDSITQAC